MKLFVKTIEFSHADCSTPVESTLIYTGAEIEYIAILKHGTIVASRVKMHIAKNMTLTDIENKIMELYREGK